MAIKEIRIDGGRLVILEGPKVLSRIPSSRNISSIGRPRDRRPRSRSA